MPLKKVGRSIDAHGIHPLRCENRQSCYHLELPCLPLLLHAALLLCRSITQWGSHLTHVTSEFVAGLGLAYSGEIR